MLFRPVASYRGARCFVCCNQKLWDKVLGDLTSVMWQGCLYFRNEALFQDMNCKRHEYRHYLQWRRHWFFHLKYFIANVRYGHSKNPFELDAWPRWFSYPESVCGR